MKVKNNFLISESLSDKLYDRLLSQNKTILNSFFELVNNLGKWFSITKATLSIHYHQAKTLKVVSLWDLNALIQGVIISLPTENSLFYQVLKSEDLILNTRNNFLTTYEKVGMGATQLFPSQWKILIINELPTKKFNLNYNLEL